MVETVLVSSFGVADAEQDGVTSPTVLVVEDDTDLAEEMSVALADYGMRPVTAATWESALAAVASARPDLVVLDQRLGRLDTLPRLAELRSRTSVPVLVLTGNRAETDRIVALEIGADDFLLKPISGRELVARIRAHLRRVQQVAPAPAAMPVASPPLEAPEAAEEAGWRLAIPERILQRPDGSLVPLTSAEFDLLAALAEVPGQAVDRDTLTRRVLRRPWRPDDRALDNLVLHLRQKLGPGGERTIATVRNQGYVFTAFPKG